MDFHADFELALVVFSLLTGLVWALDVVWLGRRRAAGAKQPWLVDFSRSFFPVVFAVLMLRSFLVEPFRIPSGSMLPTLLAGDFILVNKFEYGIRLPVLHTKLWGEGVPERGDVVVFRFPPDPSKDFIKRIVGLPGDAISYRDKQLYVNGARVMLEPAGDYRDPRVPELYGVDKLIEQLGEGSHAVLHIALRPGRDTEVVVPLGHYFVMGDNRDGSDDSRRWGFVPEANLVGHAFFIWMSWDGARRRPDFARIGERIR